MFSLAENPDESYRSLCILYRRHPRLLLILILAVLLSMAAVVESAAAEPTSPVIALEIHQKQP